jgi:hypothetical protein
VSALGSARQTAKTPTAFACLRIRVVEKTSREHAVGTVFRSSKHGSLSPLVPSAPTASQKWFSEKTGEIVDSLEHHLNVIRGWVVQYCTDDEGRIPVLNFQNMLFHFAGQKIEIRDGISIGPRGPKFGFFFSKDSPPVGFGPDDVRPFE